MRTYSRTTTVKRPDGPFQTHTKFEAHFATAPTGWVRPCILAGTSAKGVCPHCGTPWQRKNKSVVWVKGCDCPAHDTIPATVLDPFGGSGTTALVAEELGRNAVLIELNPSYAKMAHRRLREGLSRVQADLPEDRPADLPLFETAAE